MHLMSFLLGILAGITIVLVPSGIYLRRGYFRGYGIRHGTGPAPHGIAAPSNHAAPPPGSRMNPPAEHRNTPEEPYQEVIDRYTRLGYSSEQIDVIIRAVYEDR
jgi:hypothetical protein